MQYEFEKILKPEPHCRNAMPRVAAEAFAWAMRAAVQGNADGEKYVGLGYSDGDGIGTGGDIAKPL